MQIRSHMWTSSRKAAVFSGPNLIKNGLKQSGKLFCGQAKLNLKLFSKTTLATSFVLKKRGTVLSFIIEYSKCLPHSFCSGHGQLTHCRKAYINFRPTYAPIKEKKNRGAPKNRLANLSALISLLLGNRAISVEINGFSSTSTTVWKAATVPFLSVVRRSVETNLYCFTCSVFSNKIRLELYSFVVILILDSVNYFRNRYQSKS